MKKLTLLLSLIAFIGLLNSQKLIAGIGDTTVVQTIRYDSTMRAGVFQFPDDSTKTYEKIIMRYGLRCKNGFISDQVNRNRGCGEWDYNCNTYIVDSTQQDSLHKTVRDHVVSNFTDTVYKYTNIPVWNYTQYTQTQIVYNSTVSETTAVVGVTPSPLSHPFDCSTTGERSQFLYKASELTAAGLTSGDITSIRLDLSSLGSSVSNLRIRLKTSTKTALAQNNPDLTGFTEVYFLNTTFSSTGIHSFNFATPFTWDGTSNIIVDFSYSLATGGTTSNVNGNNTAFVSGLTTNSDNSALVFDGSQNYIVPDTSFLSSVSDKITIACWVKGDSLRLPTQGTSLFYGTDAQNNRALNIHLPWTDSNIYWDCGYATGGFDRIQKVATAAEMKGNWQFWAFTKNATTGKMNIYLNGHLWQTGTGKTKLISLKDFNIGFGQGTGPYLGLGQQFSIWNKDLDSNAIKNIMYSDITPANPDYANLLVYYKLDENNGNIAHNSGPTPLDGHINNPVWRAVPGRDRFKNFSELSDRPNITFVKGVYTTTTNNFTVLDSVMKTPNSVITYSVVNSRLNVVDTTFSWTAGPNYVYNSAGAVVDTLNVIAQDTIPLVLLNYYAFRPMYFELINFITPYGIDLDLEGLTGRTYQFDVTDFTPLLKGRRYLAMEGGNYQEDNDIQFVFYEGTPPRNVRSISQIWPNGTWAEVSYNNILNNTYFELRNIHLDSAASMFKIRSTISGHGSDGEFTSRTHTLRLNNAINFNNTVWTTTCSSNPIYPQGGTWVYSRAGWCPGMAVITKEFEITPYVTPGQTVSLDYSLPYVISPGQASYRVNHQLVSYDAPNHQVDAAVAYIKSPSKRPEYLRFNPLCDDPVIQIRNTGSDTLTSLDITYGRINGTMSNYHWTGSLKFLDTATVVLPANQWMTSGTDAFSVTLSNPNGVTDQYPANDTMTSEFNIPDAYNGTLVFEFKTNKTTQDNYNIKDASGTVVLNRPGSIINHTYLDTITLPPGCYVLSMIDGGNNGLTWWADTAQGSGYFQMFDGNGNFLHAFEQDFGNNIYYQFTVGFSLPVNEVVKDKPSLFVFPNPSSDFCTAKISAQQSSKAMLTVTDLLGKTVKEQSIFMTQAIEHVRIETGDLNPGIYIVRLESGDFKVEEKLVICK